MASAGQSHESFCATISACLIVKDEASVLERCLASLEGAVDEIIMVDTGSSQTTNHKGTKTQREGGKSWSHRRLKGYTLFSLCISAHSVVD